MIVDVDKIVVSLDVVAPDAVVVEASAVLQQPPFINSEIVLPVQVISKEEIPDVSPLQIVDYGSASIECAFDVTTEQAEEVVRGVLCGTTNPPTFDNADYRLLHGQGNMDLAFAGLHGNTEYFLRPYALSNLGYKYGDVVAQRTKNSPIPDEYQLVEYLENTGSSYIATQCLMTNATEVEIEYNDYNTGSIISCRGTNNNTIFLVSSYYGLQCGSTSYPCSRGQHTCIISKEKIVLDGLIVATHTDYVNGGYPLALFCQNRNGSYSYNGRGYINKMIIKDEGVNIASMYPVYRKSDHKPGMYDMVNNVFYTNRGSGEFQVGPDKEWEE